MRSLLCAAAVACLMMGHGASGDASPTPPTPVGDHGRLGLRGIAYDLNGYDATGYDVLGFNLADTDRWGRSISNPAAGLTAPANSTSEKVAPEGKANGPHRAHDKPTSTIAWTRPKETAKKEKEKDDKKEKKDKTEKKHEDKPKVHVQPKVNPVSTSTYTNMPTSTYFDGTPTPEPTAITGGIVMFNVTGDLTELEAAAYLKEVLNMMGFLDVVWDPLGMTKYTNDTTGITTTQISVLVYSSATVTEISRNVQNQPAAWRQLGTRTVILVGADGKVTSLAVDCDGTDFLLANRCYECPTGQTCTYDAR
eukprot:comp9124_c0_seq1/m.4289 comp9124_c0_seq1/g.4289  ORF comp9124_c0_seq1/g.4289 comp9124_c0_seq1/m.4289 type:complete len:308 (-) comp9124_c0_seq1:367-1290(-)